MNNPLQTLMDLHAKTTQGEWALDQTSDDEQWVSVRDTNIEGDIVCEQPENGLASCKYWPGNAAFIAAAHNLLPALAAHVAELEARALPVLPDGWRIDELQHAIDDTYHVGIFNRKTEQYITRSGPTPPDAIRNAINQVEETK